MRRKAYVGTLVLAAVLICAAVLIHVVRATSFMAEAGQLAESFMTEKLGTTVHVGAVEIHSLHELKLDDVIIYDKQAEPVLRADEARVTLRLLSLLSSPETSIDEILGHMQRLCSVTTVRGTTAISAHRMASRVRLRDASAWRMRRRMLPQADVRTR